jgi:hypothetical protein
VPQESSFWNRVAAENAKGCRLWTGAASRNGYGSVGYGGRRWITHRLAWHIANNRLADPLPPNVQIRHKCDVRLCCNPAHLEPGSAADNAQDAVDRGHTGANGRPLGTDHGGSITLDIIAMRRAGLPVRVIAKRLETSERNIYYHLAEMKKMAALTEPQPESR